MAVNQVKAAIGLRAHSGWAALVSIAGPAESPAVISRKRIVIADPSFPGSKQPYHFVESMSLSEASAIVARCWKSSVELAAEALAAEKKSLAAKGFDAQVCGVLQGRITEMPPLERILTAHPLLHTAEGVMFRQVLLLAAAACGMRAIGTAEKSLEERAAETLGVPPASVLPRLTELGRGLGSPWTIDQKYATAAAWLALAQQL
jgi:hypothetical protein